jgi:phenylalanyl-tRNA synthetase beta chain
VLAARAEYNLSRMQGNVRHFETGGVFEPGRAGAGRAVARRRAGDGRASAAALHRARPPAFDAWDAQGARRAVPGRPFPGAPSTLVPAHEDGRLWHVEVGGRATGEVRQLALDAPPWASPAFGVELTLSAIDATPVAAAGRRADGSSAAAPAAAHLKARPLPATPAAEFDLALVVPDEVSAGEVDRVLRSAGGDLLEDLMLFDEFRGGDVPAGTRSLAWRLVLRDPTRTLREKEVEGRRQKLLKALESELGVRQRAAG